MALAGTHPEMEVAALRADELVLAVDGRFDLPAAWNICHRIAHAGPVARLVVDFTRAAQVLDDALATFADRAPRLREHLRVRGLSRHHHRVLAYLGMRLHDGLPSFSAD
jgi:hypothetical protein